MSDERHSVGPPSTADGELTEREHQMLRFESQWWRRTGAKAQAINDQFGMSDTRFYQALNALIDRPAALAHYPTVVNRLRKRRERRRPGRPEGRLDRHA